MPFLRRPQPHTPHSPHPHTLRFPHTRSARFSALVALLAVLFTLGSLAAPRAVAAASTTTVITTDVASYDAVGQVITYTMVFTNTSDVVAENRGTDPIQFIRGGTGAVTGWVCTQVSQGGSCANIASMAPGQSITYTATYTVTQADLEFGAVVIQSGGSISTENQGGTGTSSQATVQAIQKPVLTLTGDRTPAGIQAPGQAISYSYTVTNTGNVTVREISLSQSFTMAGKGNEPSFSCIALTNPAGACVDGVATLAPGQSASFTVEYTAILADFAFPQIASEATASGFYGTPAKVASSELSALSVMLNPALGLGLLAEADRPTFAAAGEVISYTITLSNLGIAPLSQVTVVDEPSGVAGAITSSCPTSLPVGHQVSCTVSYTVTAEDVAAGKVLRQISATSRAPGNVNVINPGNEVLVSYQPAITPSPQPTVTASPTTSVPPTVPSESVQPTAPSPTTSSSPIPGVLPNTGN